MRTRPASGGWAWGGRLHHQTLPAPGAAAAPAAVLRRVYRAAAEEVPARLGARRSTGDRGTLRRDGGEAPLTAKEFALLKSSGRNRGNIVTIDALCQALWEGPMVGYENTLMVHIRRLREKLEADPSHPKYLLTVRGLGYRLVREAAP